MAEFTFTPSTGYTKDTTPRFRVAQFGDGYSQRAPDGINNIDIQWNLTFQNRSYPQANAIVAFFSDLKGTEAFDWIPTDELTTYKVICDKWSENITSPFTKTVTATFTLVFDQ